jgi:hypothetical protein
MKNTFLHNLIKWNPLANCSFTAPIKLLVMH